MPGLFCPSMWRKARIPLALLLFLVVVTHADTPPGGKEQLRKLAKLPTVSFQFGFAFNAVDGLSDLGTTLDPADEIASIQKAMQDTPSDAGRYYRLSQLYGKQAADKDKSEQALNKSIELFRQRVDQQPENGRLLADFGEALDGSTNHLKAEHVLRKAVRIATNDWHGWANLGGLLQNRAFQSIYNDAGAKEWSADAILKWATFAKPTPDHLKEAQSCMDEAMGCYDRAVAVAPEEPEAYFKRAGACHLRNMFDILTRAASGEETDARKIGQAFASSEGVAENFKEIARLNPRNYRAIGIVIMFEITRGTASAGFAGNSAATPVNSLPDNSQKAVRAGMTTLQKLEDDPDYHVAAGALETEGTIEYVLMGDPVSGEKKLRRALALDPARDSSAEVLTGFLTQSKNFTDMLPVCEARANRNPTPRSLLLLAKAHEMLGHTAEAEKQMQGAVQLAPDDFNSQLGLAAMLLRHTDDASLSSAADHIRLARTALAKLPSSDATSQQEIEYLFTAGLYQGLAGNTERARDAFDQILKNDPDNADAKAALAALGK